MRLTRRLAVWLLLPCWLCCAAEKDSWVSLFDGVSLDGWRASESPGTFSVADREIVARGPRAHLFYVGPIAAHNWTDFELILEVRTSPGANSGVYFHTHYQEEGWPESGYQVQINNTNPYPSRTGGLYGVDDRLVTPVRDHEWFTLSVRVEGKRIITKVNDEVICDYTEPDRPKRRDEVKGSVLSHGTFALQGHDEDSEIRFRNIRVRVPPAMSAHVPAVFPPGAD